MAPLVVPGFTLGTVLKILGIVLLTGFILWYVLFQARNFLNGPVIELQGDYPTVAHTRVLPIEGTARNIVKLTLNGREITTTKEGAFAEHVVLENGYTVLTLEAFDRFGRSTSVAKEFVFVPEPESGVVAP